MNQVAVCKEITSALASFVELFEQQVERTPYAVAIEFEGKATSYTELNQRANQLASFLLLNGFESEDRIGICLDRSDTAIIAMLGILKAGCAFVPLDPEFPPDRLAYIVEHASIRTILCDEGYRHLYSVSSQLELIDPNDPALWEGNSGNHELNLAPDALAYVMYTSGSTGKPKGVQIEHRSLTTYCLADVELYKLQPDDRTLQFSTLNFDVAIEEIYPPLLVGSAVVVRPRVRANAAIELSHLVESNAITALHIATAYWNEWVDLMAASQVRVPASLRLVIVTGEKISVEHYRRWLSLCDHKILWCNAYGPTETTVTCTAFIPDDSWDEPQMPIGKPLPGYTAFILDDQLKPVVGNDTGALFIGGPALARGYLDRPDLTERAFLHVTLPGSEEPQRIYRTGDLARWLPSGDIEFAGRVDHQMKVGSYRIEPGEIESVIHQNPSVRESLVVCDEVQGQKYLVAYVVRNGAIESSEIVAYLRERLPVYMVPTRYIFIEAMPKTINGKIDRRALPPASTAELARESDKREATSDLERELVKIWSSVLNVPEVGIDDDFFLLGGSSLLVTRVIAQITSRFKYAIPVRDFFANPTIASLALQLQSVDVMANTPVGSEQHAQISRRLRSRLPKIIPFELDSLSCKLAGIHYPPVEQAASKRQAIVIAPAYGHEYARSHRNLQQLAILLAQSGLDVLRFDYAGTGNSEGDHERISCHQWSHDLAAVLRFAKQLPGVAGVHALGIRLGASLLCSADLQSQFNEIDQLICWDPVIDGSEYLQAIDAFHYRELSGLTRFLSRRSASGQERLGYAWPPSLADGIKCIQADCFARSTARMKSLIFSERQSTSERIEIQIPVGWQSRTVDDEIYWNDQAYISSAFASPSVFRTVLELLQG
ncbi:MAG: amino acid adenylation domain-containing protein [Pirellulaceae bacterium]|nr:amino acid adenylation domain-containing protein [Pirellulaceae bacterium]